MDFTFKIITYGCKVNQYESQSLREYWKSLGGKELFDKEVSDIVLLSGCAVTAQGVSDARQMVRKLLRDSPKSKVIVTGCAASAEPDDFLFENVVACINQTAKWKLLYCHPLDLCAGDNSDCLNVCGGDKSLNSRTFLSDLSCKQNVSKSESMGFPNEVTLFSDALEKQTLLNHNIVYSEELKYPEFTISDFERSRPVLKIQDGCSHGCSYCIVPFTRGKARSRDVAQSLAEFSRLIEKGFREVVISGINLRQYQFKEQVQGQCETGNFWKFLRRLHKHVQEEDFYASARKQIPLIEKQSHLEELAQSPIRIRLSSLEPSQIGHEGLETLEELSENGFLCPHLHLSLQSGAEGILKRMGREHYAPETIIDIMQKIRSFWPRFALGADFLMGFAGETEEELQETLCLVDALPLTYAHVFPYSMRPKTKAASFKGHVDKKIRQEHAKKVREHIEIKKKNFMQTMLALESMYISLDCAHERQLPSDILQKSQYHETDITSKLIGWNEFYVSCQIETKHINHSNNTMQLQELARSHELIRVKPIKILEDKLVTILF